MADLYEDYGLEIEPDNFGADPQLTPQKTTVVKKGGILGKVIALALGFTIGAGGVIGGVAGAGYFMVSTPIKDTVGAVSNLAGIEIDYTKFLTEDYARLTVLDLVQSLPAIAEKFGNGTGTLNDLNKISPLVSTALDPVVEKVAEFGLTLDKDTLMDTPVSELPTYLADEAKNMKLADLLNTAGMAETPLIKAICYDQDGNPTTIKDLMDGGPEGLLGNIPLEALLIAEDGVVDSDKDTLIMALAYGNANRYEVGADNKVTMKQMAFSRIGNELYDIDGNKVEGAVLGAGGVFTITDEDDNVYYAAPQAATFSLRAAATPYYAYKDAECNEALLYKKAMVSDLLGGNATDLFNELELGSILSVSPLKEDSDPIMLSLAYGEKGVHYDVVEVNGEKTIEWKVKDAITGEKYAPRTILDLTSGATDIFNEIQLGTVLSLKVTDEITDANALTHALAYGYKDTHFSIDAQGNVTWLNGNAPRTIKDITEMGNVLDEIRLGTVLGMEITDEITDSNSLTHALAFGYEGTHYTIENGTVVWKQKPTTDPNAEVEYYSYRTVGNMEEMNDIINELRLGSVLGMEVTDEITDSNSLTHALAFGYEGTHFNIDGEGNVTWIGDNAPRTVDDISNMNDLINEIRIESALSVTYESPRLLHVLAYGSEGDGFKYIKNGETIVGIETYKYNTIASLSASEDNLIDSLTLSDIIGQEAVEDDLLLSHLGDATLESLPNEIAGLTFKQVYPEQIYETRYLTAKEGIVLTYNSENDEFFYMEGGNKYVYTKEVVVQYQVEYVEDYAGNNKIDPANWPDEIKQVGEKYWINETDLVYIAHGEDGYYHIDADNRDDQLQVHLQLHAQWKYLLSVDGESHDYKMTEFATLVENMTHNMQNATLYDLAADGIVNLEESTLKTKVITKIGAVDIVVGATASNPEDGLVLGDLTVTQMMNYTAAVLNAVNFTLGNP